MGDANHHSESPWDDAKTQEQPSGGRGSQKPTNGAKTR
jgi:hypothetical protein